MGEAVLWLPDVSKAHLSLVGGKGASLGEMWRAQIPVPPAFVVPASAYQQFLEASGLREPLRRLLGDLKTDDPQALETTARHIQGLLLHSPIPPEVAEAVREAYGALGGGLVAVRSSATAEDLAEASFAGQQSTFLNIVGEEAVLEAVRRCWASLFEPRAIFYRAEKGFDHLTVSMAVVVQKMVQAEVSGVLFTVEPVSGDGTLIALEAVYGLGEAAVSGAVTPDFYLLEKGDLRIREKKVSRQARQLVRNPEYEPGLTDPNIWTEVPPEAQEAPKLTDEEIIALARLGRRIEEHYGSPQDIEWAREGGQFYILQARSITTLGVRERAELQRIFARVLLTGSGASPGIATGRVKVVRSLAELSKVEKGDVLVTEMTTPDFVPAMKRSSAIVTDRGGRTCHAAIVSRELGVPCVVGTEQATSVLQEGQWITVDGLNGVVYEGRIEVQAQATTTRRRLKTATRVYVNLADPELAEVVAGRDVDGVGLLRAEFMIAHIGEHPRFMLETGRGEKWVQKLAEGIEAFARAFAPRPVVYRLTDFKTNEYRNLLGGEKYEPREENPMLGYRGASRYIREREVFALEARAIRRVWERFRNLYVMVPFVRTPQELAGVRALLEEEGLRREDGLKLWIMVEIPSNVLLLDQFLDVGVDGVSIGSNDLTQLVLGIDRDNAQFQEAFDERDPAVLWCLERVIRRCAERGVTSSICGQAPSFYPDLTEKLVSWGITSVSVSPDMIERTREVVARAEKRLGRLPPQEAEG